MPTPLSQLEDASEFHARHIGPDAVDESLMCAAAATSREARYAHLGLADFEGDGDRKSVV